MVLRRSCAEEDSGKKQSAIVSAATTSLCMFPAIRLFIRRSSPKSGTRFPLDRRSSAPVRGPFTSGWDTSAAARGPNRRRIQSRVGNPYKLLGLQQAGYGDILINSLLVNAAATTDQFPCLSLFRRCLQETRKPGKRD